MNKSLPEMRQIENEMIFRRKNEKVSDRMEVLDKMHANDGTTPVADIQNLELHFLCECSDENCVERIPLKVSQYQEIHKNRKLFIVMPGHEVVAIEKVVRQEPAFSVVKKKKILPEAGKKLNDTATNNA